MPAALDVGSEESVEKGICEPDVQAALEGPSIEVVRPDLGRGSLTAPFEVDIRFRQRRAPIELSSLAVRGSRWGFTRDLTEQVRGFASPEGIRGVFPPVRGGCYRLEIRLRDASGRWSELSFRAQIVGGES